MSECNTSVLAEIMEERLFNETAEFLSEQVQLNDAQLRVEGG